MIDGVVYREREPGAVDTVIPCEQGIGVNGLPVTGLFPDPSGCLTPAPVGGLLIPAGRASHTDNQIPLVTLDAIWNRRGNWSVGPMHRPLAGRQAGDQT